MIAFLTDDAICEIMETDEANEEKFGVLFTDGESVDCVSLNEATELVFKYGGEIYTCE